LLQNTAGDHFQTQRQVGGARVITYVQVVHHSVYLLAIYDKAEQADIADTDLKNLLKLIP
jgi:hypothetical protein